MKQWRPGERVQVPWGLARDREGGIVDIWGDPRSPSQVRVRLDSVDDEEGPVVLLLAADVPRRLATA